jgi:photosystem II stability/assembly factor-like uncharacterized protein
MKTSHILLLASLFTLHASLVAQQYGWTDISANVPGDPDFSDVFFVSDDEGWISVSSGPEIYHTTDGGETFEIQETSLGTSTAAIYMIDDNEGYTGGGSGFVYRTLDGGTNWDLLGAMSSSLNELDFASSTQGYACGDNGAVFSITPEGVTNLNSGLSSDLAGITSPSENNVWVCGENKIVYFNGVMFQFQSGPVGSFNSIFFIDDNEGWVVGNAGLIGHTEDGGETWHSQINPDPDQRSMFDVFFLDENIGWAIGINGIILETINGGDDWIIDEEGSALAGTNFLTGVYFISPTNGYVVGNEKTLLKYTEISGIEETESLRFELYPNPAVSAVSLQSAAFSQQSAVVEIYDLNGRKLLEKQIPARSEIVEIDVSSLQSGIYCCRLVSEKYSATQKLVIQK